MKKILKIKNDNSTNELIKEFSHLKEKYGIYEDINTNEIFVVDSEYNYISGISGMIDYALMNWVDGTKGNTDNDLYRQLPKALREFC